MATTESCVAASEHSVPWICTTDSGNTLSQGTEIYCALTPSLTSICLRGTTTHRYTINRAEIAECYTVYVHVSLQTRKFVKAMLNILRLRCSGPIHARFVFPCCYEGCSFKVSIPASLSLQCARVLWLHHVNVYITISKLSSPTIEIEFFGQLQVETVFEPGIVWSWRRAANTLRLITCNAIKDNRFEPITKHELPTLDVFLLAVPLRTTVSSRSQKTSCRHSTSCCLQCH